MQRELGLEDKRRCKICNGAVDRLDAFSSAVVNRWGMLICPECAEEPARVAKLVGIEGPTLDNLAGSLSSDCPRPAGWHGRWGVTAGQQHRLVLALAHLGYYPWESAAQFAAETSEEELDGLRGVTATTVAKVAARLGDYGHKLRDNGAPHKWEPPAPFPGLALPPRASLNVNRVCAAFDLLRPAVAHSHRVCGDAATLAALVETDRLVREIIGEREGTPREAAVHIESRELASLHAGLHAKEEADVSERQS